jgi:lysophospholipase L1-like esterase
MMMNDQPVLMLMGDSIRMRYQPMVAELLQGEARVVAPGENARFALYTLQLLDRWLKDLPAPDVIHWNNGLWDVGHSTERVPAQIPLDMYVGNLEFILRRLRATGATVVWATITPIHPPRLDKGDGWSWENGEIDRYNAAATDLMTRHAVPINDLNAVVRSNIDRYLPQGDHHVNEAGAHACASAVVESVRSYLLPVGRTVRAETR